MNRLTTWDFWSLSGIVMLSYNTNSVRVNEDSGVRGKNGINKLSPARQWNTQEPLLKEMRSINRHWYQKSSRTCGYVKKKQNGMYSIDQDSETFSGKGHMVHTLGFVGHRVPVATTQVCHHSPEAAADSM